MSELDKIKKQQQEMIEARKRKQGIESAEPLPSAGGALQPSTPREKWENYWYHYKWHTMAGIFVLIFLGIALSHMLFPTRYDVSLTLVSKESFEGANQVMLPGLESFCEDYDGNGKTAVDFTAFQLSGVGMTPQMEEMNRMKLMAHSSLAENFVYLLDDTGYTQLTEIGMDFLDLDRWISSGRVDGDRYRLDDSELAKRLGVDQLLDVMYLCFVDYTQFEDGWESDRDLFQAYERNRSFFENLVQADS